jgi:hypothetical protein
MFGSEIAMGVEDETATDPLGENFVALLQKTALNMGNPFNGTLIQLKRLVEKNISIDSSGFLQRHQIAREIRGDAQGVRIKSTQIVCQTLDLGLRNRRRGNPDPQRS